MHEEKREHIGGTIAKDTGYYQNSTDALYLYLLYCLKNLINCALDDI